MSNYDATNIFAKILNSEMPAIKLFENEHCIAIMDVFPQSRGHCLVVPHAASRNLLDADISSVQHTMVHIQKLANAVKTALKADGVRIAQFNEAPAGQTVFHLHWHIIPVFEGQSLKAHAGEMADMADLESIAEKIRTAL